MDNWVKFGNPDGKQPMEVSIALPTFLLEKEHHNTILIIYLIGMVVIIPCKTGQHCTILDQCAWHAVAVDCVVTRKNRRHNVLRLADWYSSGMQ